MDVIDWLISICITKYKVKIHSVGPWEPFRSFVRRRYKLYVYVMNSSL